MDSLLRSPVFVAYATTTLVLCLNLLGLWGYSGAARAKSKTTINREDSERFGSPLVEADPPAVARVLRAHANAQATIYPFLATGLLYVLAGGALGTAKALFGIFVAARLLHSFVYLAGKQPWRTMFFVVGLLATFALMGNVVMLLVQGPAAP